MHFLLTEWEHVVDAWQLKTWEEYRDVARLGRKTRLRRAQRAVLWSILSGVGTAECGQTYDLRGNVHLVGGGISKSGKMPRI